ncbi:DUF4124 domain-containing protein [Pseudoalteromonas mariniglutinosa]|uniref:DUF4124 domain-containing protein n=1 Tax=Pseudoalteromonas mariniglutinosa TaxID=206042 RepID=UPI00384D5FD7
MKRFCYFAITLLLFSVVLLFYIKRPDGQAYINSNDVSHAAEQAMYKLKQDAREGIEQSKQAISNQLANFTTPSETVTQVYKWQDEHGQWHYSDIPSEQYHTILVTLDEKDMTVLPALSADERIASQTPAEVKRSDSTLGVYDPRSVQQLYENAENVKELMEQRQKQLKQPLDN